ncbi:MAG: YtxH domain-containing protein [Gemmatimonadetes bacterium]|nr:YtxH domain-containing protein [Gemmatimonadota bacterium]
MDDDARQALSFLSGVALGALIGAGIALLVAPWSGRRTRRHIVRVAEDLSDGAGEGLDEARSEARRAARDAVRKAERRGARLREAARRARRSDD